MDHCQPPVVFTQSKGTQVLVMWCHWATYSLPNICCPFRVGLSINTPRALRRKEKLFSPLQEDECSNVDAVLKAPNMEKFPFTVEREACHTSAGREDRSPLLSPPLHSSD